MNQHDKPTLGPCPFCGRTDLEVTHNGTAARWYMCMTCRAEGPAGDSDAEAIEAWNSRAALSATHPAQAAQSEPVKPLFASKVASRKWSELQEAGARMQSIAFDGHKSGQPGTIDPWGVVRWGQAAQGAGEVEPAAYRYKVPTHDGKGVWTFTLPQRECILETQALYTQPAPPPAQPAPVVPDVLAIIDAKIEAVRKANPGRGGRTNAAVCFALGVLDDMRAALLAAIATHQQGSK